MQLNLIAREMTYEMFIQKLAEGKTNGIDITILAICEMFDISIIVLFENFLWKSDEIPWMTSIFALLYSAKEDTCQLVDEITARWQLKFMNQ